MPNTSANNPATLTFCQRGFGGCKKDEGERVGRSVGIQESDPGTNMFCSRIRIHHQRVGKRTCRQNDRRHDDRTVSRT